MTYEYNEQNLLVKETDALGVWKSYAYDGNQVVTVTHSNGLVENYSFVKCPDCGKEIKIFGESNIDAIAQELNAPVLGKMPIDMDYASKADSGAFHEIENVYIEAADAVMPK